MISPTTDLAGHIKSFAACASENSNAASLITAGGTGDGTKVTGESIDTLTDRGDSMALIVSGLATLGASKTMSLTAELQESSDDSTWDTAEAVYAVTVVATDSGSGSNLYFVKEAHVKLKDRKRYIRFNVTGTLSATSTDTALFSSVAVMAGCKTLPVT